MKLVYAWFTETIPFLSDIPNTSVVFMIWVELQEWKGKAKLLLHLCKQDQCHLGRHCRTNHWELCCSDLSTCYGEWYNIQWFEWCCKESFCCLWFSLAWTARSENKPWASLLCATMWHKLFQEAYWGAKISWSFESMCPRGALKLVTIGGEFTNAESPSI